MTRPSPERRFFDGLWLLVLTRRNAILIVAFLLAAACAFVTVRGLRLNSDQDRLVSPRLPFQKRYLELLENFGDQEYIYLVITSDGTDEGADRARAFADFLAEKIERHRDLIHAVHYRVGPQDLGSAALLYPSLKELRRVLDGIRIGAPRLRNWLDEGTLPGLIDQLREAIDSRSAWANVGDPKLAATMLSGLADRSERLEAALRGEAQTGRVGKGVSRFHRYAFTPSGRLLVMRILPEKNYETLNVIDRPLALLREALKETRAAFPGVQAGITGRPVLQADEMRTTDLDMKRASGLAILLVGFLFLFVFRGWRRPAFILLSLLAAMAWTFGFATVAVGELNLLSIVFALVLIGIGVDFGVHVAMRTAEEYRRNGSVSNAVRDAVIRTGPGILLGAVTSVCAFYAVLGSDFVGLAELGLIGGTGILLCLLAMLTVLPALMLRWPGQTRRDETPRKTRMNLSFFGPVTRRPVPFLMALLAVTVAAAPGIIRVKFNYNLLELQARGIESVETEKRLVGDAGDSTWYAMTTADTPEQLSEKTARLRQVPGISKLETLLDYIPGNQGEKLGLLAEIRADLKPPSASPVTPSPPDAKRMVQALSELEGSLEGLEELLFSAGADRELDLLDRVLRSLRHSRELLAAKPSTAARLSGLHREWFAALQSLYETLWTLLDPKPVTPETLPALLRELFVGRDGALQIKVFPQDDIWNFENLQRFVADLRAADPLVSGVPVGVYESSLLMRRTFLSAAGLTLVLVCLLLYGYARSLRRVLLTLLPLAVSLVWLLEVMGWAGLKFNLANFFSIPILIAIGVDGGVHLLARWDEMRGRGDLFITGTPTAVALSFATTMLGFGGLLLAHHQGLASLGSVMVLGSATGMAAAILVLPAVLAWIGVIK